MSHAIDDAHPGDQELNEQDQATPSGRMETPSPERLGRARTAHRGYYRWLRLSRLTLGAFVVVAAVLFIWLVPWLPSGLDTNDYTPELQFTVYLLGITAITGMLALGFRELARRDRESLMVWGTVYDEATGLHNRTYLYDRLSLECERAERGGDVFSLILLQIRLSSSGSDPPPLLSSAALQHAAELIDRLTHAADLVALLSGSELAILAMGANRESRRPLQDRLRSAVAAGLPGFLDDSTTIDVKGGAATFGVDGNDPATLVQAARTAMILALPKRAQAA